MLICDPGFAFATIGSEPTKTLVEHMRLKGHCILGFPASEFWNPVKGRATCAHWGMEDAARAAPSRDRGGAAGARRALLVRSDQGPGSAIAARTAAAVAWAMTRARGGAVAGVGSRDHVVLSGGVGAAGALPPSRGHRRRGPVGASRRGVHAHVRGPGRVADRAYQQDGGLGADADRLAVGRLDLPAGRRRSSSPARSARWP